VLLRTAQSIERSVSHAGAPWSAYDLLSPGKGYRFDARREEAAVDCDLGMLAPRQESRILAAA